MGKTNSCGNPLCSVMVEDITTKFCSVPCARRVEDFKKERWIVDIQTPVIDLSRPVGEHTYKSNTVVGPFGSEAEADDFVESQLEPAMPGNRFVIQELESPVCTN